jgi:hypothetical protein
MVPLSPLTLTLGGRQGRLTLNDDVEADTALAVGLPPFEVSEAELPYLSLDSAPVRPPPSHRLEASSGPAANKEGAYAQDDYVVIRNFLLAKWRVDPYRHLLPEDAMGSIQRRHFPLVQAAHRFLERHGYINFGVAPALRYVSPDATTPPEASTSNQSLPSVLIIGAGLAGPWRVASRIHCWPRRLSAEDWNALVCVAPSLLLTAWRVYRPTQALRRRDS